MIVNPIDPDNIEAFWQQDRWSNGGCRGNGAGTSLNGGVTWDIVPVPGIADCTGSPLCEGDFNEDGDVEGSDPAILAADFSWVDCPN